MQTITQNAIGTLIEANKQFRKEHQLWADADDLHQFLRDFGTVGVQVHQRSGKTQFILDNAGPSDLVIVSSYDLIGKTDTEATVKTVDIVRGTIDSGAKCDVEYSTIWVDEFWWQDLALADLIRLFGLSSTQTFVLLGSPR